MTKRADQIKSEIPDEIPTEERPTVVESVQAQSDAHSDSTKRGFHPLK